MMENTIKYEEVNGKVKLEIHGDNRMVMNCAIKLSEIAIEHYFESD